MSRLRRSDRRCIDSHAVPEGWTANQVPIADQIAFNSATIVHHAQQETLNAVSTFGKLLDELHSNTAVSTSGRGSTGAQMEAEAEEIVYLGRVPHFSHEIDGGVRLAGGRPGEVVAEPEDSVLLDNDGMSADSKGPTLPPPYSSHL